MSSPEAYNPSLRREGLCISGRTFWLMDPTPRWREVQNYRTVGIRPVIAAARGAAEVPLPLHPQLHLRRDARTGCALDPARGKRNGEGERVNDSSKSHPSGTPPTDTLERKETRPSPEVSPATNVPSDASGTEGLKPSEIIDPRDVWNRVPRDVPARLVERLSRVARHWQETHSCLRKQP